MSLICLVHGSTQNSSCWDLLIPELDRLGHSTVRPDLPTDEPEASGTFYAEVIAKSIPDSVNNAVVVAHSVSGLFLPLVAARRPIKRLIFLTALIPELGRSFIDQVQADKSMLNPDWIGVDPTKDDNSALRFLFHDCSPEILNWALSTRSLMNARRALSEPCPLDSWPDVPSSYILCTEDRVFEPEWFRRAAKDRLGTNAIELAAGHCPQISQPISLAKLISSLV
jgi:pimeloyl-ACP methyl ester carboxylesterase